MYSLLATLATVARSYRISQGLGRITISTGESDDVSGGSFVPCSCHSWDERAGRGELVDISDHQSKTHRASLERGH